MLSIFILNKVSISYSVHVLIITAFQKETFAAISEELDTYEEALNLTSTSQDRTEQTECKLQSFLSCLFHL